MEISFFDIVGFMAREKNQRIPPVKEVDELIHLTNLDSKSIGAVFDKYFSEVYRYVRYRVSDEQTAEDIASDVFLRLIEAVQKRKGPKDNLRGWLISTASNVVNDHMRREYRRPVDELGDSHPDESASLRLEYDQREKKRAVRSGLVQLTEEQQHVLALRFGLGYSLEETARVLKKKENAVKALQFRALTSLQRMIGEVDE